MKKRKLAEAVKALPDGGGLPSPWLTWVLVALLRFWRWLVQNARGKKLHPDLVPYLVKRREVGTMLKHPLVYMLAYTPDCNALLNRQYLAKLKITEESLAKKDYDSYILMYERPYRMKQFINIQDKLSDDEYWKLLRWIWADSENLWQYNFCLGTLLRCGRPNRHLMMDEGEREFLAKLPQSFTIYRGHQGKRNRMGWSWSLSYFKARWFAERFNQKGAAVIRATVNRNDVIAYFGGMNEYEIVVDPNLVADVKTVRPKKRRDWMQEVLDEACAGFKLSGSFSDHGLRHWEAVERNALALARATPKADETVAQLFALVHDSKRENENTDPDHGERAGDYVETLYKRGKLPVTVEQKDLLVYACKLHEKGQTSDNPTIGVCWDADRLDLPRVGITPDPNLLSTKAGKEMMWEI